MKVLQSPFGSNFQDEAQEKDIRLNQNISVEVETLLPSPPSPTIGQNISQPTFPSAGLSGEVTTSSRGAPCEHEGNKENKENTVSNSQICPLGKEEMELGASMTPSGDEPSTQSAPKPRQETNVDSLGTRLASFFNPKGKINLFINCCQLNSFQWSQISPSWLYEKSCGIIVKYFLVTTEDFN